MDVCCFPSFTQIATIYLIALYRITLLPPLLAMASLTDYSVDEIAQMTIWQRLSLYDWKIELFSIALIVGYFILYKIGSSLNDKVAVDLIAALVPTLKENFYQVGVTSSKLYVKDDCTKYSFYATGRLRIESMIMKINLKPRNNLFLWAMELVMSFFMDNVPTPEDTVRFEFQYDAETMEKFDDFIWAIVTKDNMDSYRQDNYFLSLTKTSENEKLPNQFVFMNEVNDMNKELYNKKLSDQLNANLQNLKFLAITDQQIEKPTKIAELKPVKRVIVEFRLTNSNINEISNFITYLVNDYLDSIVNKANFRPELTRKVKKTREIEYNKLKKQLDDMKRDELNNKKIEEQKKLKASMTPEEQQKLAKRQQERKQRKQMNRQKVRGSM